MSEAKITAKCECGNVFRLGAQYAGKTVKCPNCAGPVPIAGQSQPPPRNQARSAGSQRAPRSKSRSRASVILMCVGGGVFLLFVVCAGLAYVGFAKLKDANIYANQPDFGDPTDLFPVDKISPLSGSFDATVRSVEGTRFDLGNVDCRKVRLEPVGENNAGLTMSLRIYMPQGEREPGSLPCVLIAPAGTNLMVGNRLNDDTYHDETLPYARAGMVAVTYSLDGACDLESATDQQLRQAYLEFRAAAAGVVNGRNALEYVLQKVPEVDPKRIYCAGHSSAGNVSLLLAAHEPRISGCIAYAPAADVEAELAEVLNDPGASILLPKLADFLKQSNPMTHLSRYKCPVFLFHARDDGNTLFIRTDGFAKRAKAAGVQVTFSPVYRGGHYQSMIDEGIPLGVEWLQSL